MKAEQAMTRVRVIDDVGRGSQVAVDIYGNTFGPLRAAKLSPYHLRSSTLAPGHPEGGDQCRNDERDEYEPARSDSYREA